MDPNDRMNAESKLQNGARNRGDGGWGRTFARFRCRHRSSRCHPMPVSMGHSGLADFILAAKSDPDVESKPARHMSLTRCLSRSGCAQRERTRRLKMKVDMPGKKRRKLAKWTSESVRPIVFVGAKNSNAGTVRPGPHQCQSLSGAHTRQQYEKKNQTRANSDVEIGKDRTFPATLLARCNNGSLGWTKVTVKNMQCWSHRRRRFSRPSILCNPPIGKMETFPGCHLLV